MISSEHRRRCRCSAGRETYSNGVLNLRYRDPVGNKINFRDVPIPTAPTSRPGRRRGGRRRSWGRRAGADRACVQLVTADLEHLTRKIELVSRIPALLE